MLPIAVDALGGDDAPRAVVDGAVAAARRGLAVVLVGPAGVVRAELARHADAAGLPVIIADAPDAVAMTDAPLAALRRKPSASIKIAADLVARGTASALFSAGHTGATFLAAHGALGVLPGSGRPALAVTVPTREGRAVLLDAGANVDCRPEHLAQFAAMGRAFATAALGVAEPRVALLTVGEEPGKGNDLVREASRLLAGTSGFIGHLDASRLFAGGVDVIVCDGFTGNVALKVGEGVAEMLGASGRFDYAEEGGAPILGVRGVAVVGHGRSSSTAMANGIALAARLVASGLVEKLEAALAK